MTEEEITKSKTLRDGQASSFQQCIDRKDKGNETKADTEYTDIERRDNARSYNLVRNVVLYRSLMRRVHRKRNGNVFAHYSNNSRQRASQSV